MITEDYVSFNTAKLLKEKGFDEKCVSVYHDGKIQLVSSLGIFCGEGYGEQILTYTNSECEWSPIMVSAPTLQMAMKWLRETHSILLVVDYDYECTDTSYCYKIYRLGEHGKPERVAAYGVSYDKNDNPTTHLVGWRDYELSYSDYGTYEEACEAGIRYCLEKLIEDYVSLDESRPDDEIINTIQQLITTARDAHSNPSLAKQYQDALDWFNKKVGRVHITQGGTMGLDTKNL